MVARPILFLMLFQALHNCYRFNRFNRFNRGLYAPIKKGRPIMAKNKFNTQAPLTFSGAIAQNMAKPTPDQVTVLKRAKAELKLAENYSVTEGDKSIRKHVIPGMKEAAELTYTNAEGTETPLCIGSLDAPTFIGMLFAANRDADIPF